MITVVMMAVVMIAVSDDCSEVMITVGINYSE
jgi:hypothetical protein